MIVSNIQLMDLLLGDWLWYFQLLALSKSQGKLDSFLDSVNSLISIKKIYDFEALKQNYDYIAVKKCLHLKSCIPVCNTAWLQNVKLNEKHGEKVSDELLKNAECCMKYSWKKQSTKEPLYSHLPPISLTIKLSPS